MKPSQRLLQVLAVAVASAIALGLWRALSERGDTAVAMAATLWWTLLGGVLLAVWLDWRQARRIRHLRVERDFPVGLSVGTDNRLSLTVSNNGEHPLRFVLTECVDERVRLKGLPVDVALAPQQQVRIEFEVHPVLRGDVVFEGIDILLDSPWGLLATRHRLLEPHTVRVFPNFTAVSNFELLAHAHQTGQLGIHAHHRRGQGLNFNQLREFRSGDSLRQVDWNATSRMMKPISREFQDERDQDILFILDSGRRMRVKDGDLSHFDHCLNAFLLTAWVALRQGDAVGFQTFGGNDHRIPPVKGKSKLNVLLNQVYQLHSSTATSDYLHAAQSVLRHHRKRALVVLISNVSAQDSDDLLAAHTLLSHHHLVVIACLREAAIDSGLNAAVSNFPEALSYVSTVDHASRRERTLRQLSSAGALVLDEPPHRLHIGLVNQYLALKRSGRL